MNRRSFLKLEEKYNLSYYSAVRMLNRELKKKRKDLLLIVGLAKVIGFREAIDGGGESNITSCPSNLGLQNVAY